MIRRHFLRTVTLSSATILPALQRLGAQSPASHLQSIQLKVQGFTCVTCAVGLETMLLRRAGVGEVKASYPQATVVVRFDPARVTEADLIAAIAEMGFKAQRQG